MYKPNNVLIHLQNKSRDGSDKTILKRDNTNINNKTKAKDYGKELFAIECGNVVPVVRPNGDTVIVTEVGELVLDNAVMEQLVRNSGAYKSFVTAKDEVVAGLERDNTKLQNEIVGLKEELKHTKAAKDKLQQELDDVANGAQSMIKGCIVEAKAYRLYDINGNFLVDCGTNSRAARAQKLLKEGKINLDMVMMVFSSEDEKKKVAANKATNDDFNWDNVPIESAD